MSRFCAYALRSGALIFRPELDGIAPLTGAILIAEGDRNYMPVTITSHAEREGATYFVPGARDVDTDRAWRAQCAHFKALIARELARDTSPRQPLGPPPMERPQDLMASMAAGRGGLR